MEFENRVAVVTGGASGIGLATARQLAKRGMHIALLDVEPTALTAAVDSLNAQHPVSVAGYRCDVTDLVALEDVARSIVDDLGGVHVVFNNAGVAVGGPIADMTHDDWRWIIDVDLWGAIHGVEVFLPILRAQGVGGHMLFTSSFAGLVPNVGLGPYCVAKYGVVALAEVLRREEREHGIGVSVLCPMRVATNIGHSERNRDARYGSAEESPAVPDQDADNADLAGRVLDVDDVAALVARAIEDNWPYILPHAESRGPIERRFQRILAAFDLATD